MSIQVIQNLNHKEKARKTNEAIKWLTEQGNLPDLESIKRLTIEAHSRAQMLANGLSQNEDYAAIASALLTYTERILNTLHGN